MCVYVFVSANICLYVCNGICVKNKLDRHFNPYRKNVKNWVFPITDNVTCHGNDTSLIIVVVVSHENFFVMMLQAWQESKFCVSLWILHGYRNAMEPLRPLRRSSFLCPLTGALIVELA